MYSLDPLARLRHQLLTSLGLTVPLASLACGDRKPSEDEATVIGNDEADSVDDMDDVDGDESGEGSGGSSSTTTGTDEAETGDGDDSSNDPCAVSPAPTPEEFTDCDLPLFGELGCANDFYLACVDAVPGQPCVRQCPTGTCTECMTNPIVLQAFGACGPYELDGQCCFLVALEDFCGGGIEGRPFVVDGIYRLASLDRRGCVPCVDPRVHELPLALREHLALHWARVARAEHASIASFAQFATRLLAIGAPPELLRDSFAAAGDEVRHAEAALALASRFDGHALGFGPLDVHGAAQEQDLEQLVLACVREGCVGETLSALELANAALACRDPELAALLRAISDDEARHASLAWRFVQWALGRDPGLRAKVAELFANLRPREFEPGPLDHEARRLLRAHGCLPAEQRRRIERDGVLELLRPCATRLLAAVDPGSANSSSDERVRA